jgi:spermidine synthase
MDAFKYITDTKDKYDYIIADFTDPRDVWTSKLYSSEFYASVLWTLNEKWIFITQASNAFFTTKAFFSIEKTIKWVFWNSLWYHRYLPSFGDWWFVVAWKWWLQSTDLCPNLWCTYFDKDYMVDYDKIKENTLTKPVIIDYYIEWYKKFNL